MFTGLVEEIGTLVSLLPQGRSIRLEFTAPHVREGARLGDSIAVDGCCLTVESLTDSGFTMFASPETLAKTSLGDRRPGDGVNLERALRLGDRLGGHLVSGHVDATGSFRSANALDDAWEVRINAPWEVLRLCVPKGSVAVDGISLTLVDVLEDHFSLWIIPETWKRTTLSRRRPGDRINLEADVLGKYVFRYLETAGNGASGAPSADERLARLLAQGSWGGRT